MGHTERQRLEKGQTLAEQVLKAVEKCRDNDMSEDEKFYHLSQIEALARDVTADCGQYNKDDDMSFIV